MMTKTVPLVNLVSEENLKKLFALFANEDLDLHVKLGIAAAFV